MNAKDYALLKYVESLLKKSNITMQVDGSHFTLIANEQRMGIFNDLNEIYQFVTGYVQGVDGRIK